MSRADTFTCFGALPKELRLQIWREAFCRPCVLAVVANRAAPDVNGAVNSEGLPLPALSFVGGAPYLAGLSCYEAKQLLERMLVRLTCTTRGLGTATGVGACWAYLDNTVVSLCHASYAVTVMNSFGLDQLSEFKHIALAWDQSGTWERACQRIATVCPSLRTLIVQRVTWMPRPTGPSLTSQI
jgi:hypothetical protein